MTVMRYFNDESEAVISGDTWTDVDTVIVNVVESAADLPRDHMIWVSCEYSGASANKEVAVRVLIDGSEVAFDHFYPSMSDTYRKFSDMGLKHCDTELSYTIVLQGRSISSSQSISIRRRRLLVIQH